MLVSTNVYRKLYILKNDKKLYRKFVYLELFYYLLRFEQSYFISKISLQNSDKGNTRNININM
jgi:hypothetical protein